MSSGQQKVRDEEEEWDSTKRLCRIEHVSWDMYSEEARHARKGSHDYHLKDDKLITYVELMKDIAELIKHAARDEEEFQYYLKLKAKYGE